MSKFQEWFKTWCHELGIHSNEEMLEFASMLQEKMDTESNLNPPKPEGECYFCHKPTTNEDYCYGCHEHLCCECAGDPDLLDCFGREHTVQEHRANIN